MNARRRPKKKVETLSPRTLYIALVIGAAVVGMLCVTPLVRYDLLEPFAALASPDAVFRAIFLLDAAVLGFFSLTCLLHATRRREWTLPLFSSSWVIGALAIGLNVPPKYGSYRAERDFVNELGTRLDSVPLAQAVFDASSVGTLMLVVASILSVGWAVGMFAVRDSTPRPGQPPSGRRILIALLLAYPVAITAFVTFVALGGAPGQS